MQEANWWIVVVMAVVMSFFLGKAIGKSEPKPPETPKTRYECLKLGSDFARTACINHYEL